MQEVTIATGEVNPDSGKSTDKPVTAKYKNPTTGEKEILTLDNLVIQLPESLEDFIETMGEKDAFDWIVSAWKSQAKGRASTSISALAKSLEDGGSINIELALNQIRNTIKSFRPKGPRAGQKTKEQALAYADMVEKAKSGSLTPEQALELLQNASI